ncbi:hypothetical protein [Amycolatopsis anabasis]|uniref:hypothetical protein n=1 Tax=Amycolatopsis anabasis TaxID=1840409 RepID=UPI00131E183A|nr:hypothetical protein [Amycolatopsis anabasis]
MYELVRSRIAESMVAETWSVPRFDAVIRLPDHLAASVPVWSLGPSYTEINTAWLWARRSGPDRFHVVARAYERGRRAPRFLHAGYLTAVELMGKHGAWIRPTSIVWKPGSGIIEHALRPDDPAVAAMSAIDRLADRVSADYENAGAPRFPPRAQVARCPDGSLQAAFHIGVSGYGDNDVDTVAAALTTLTLGYGPTARLRVLPPCARIGDYQLRLQPLASAAWAALGLDRAATRAAEAAQEQAWRARFGDPF